jgi:hypothetical protein
MMTNDKIKAAARARMAATGESYTVARRAVVREQHQAAIDRQTRESGSARHGFALAPAQFNLVSRARMLEQLAGTSAISKQLEQLAGTSAISKQLEQLAGTSAISKQLEQLAGTSAISKQLEQLAGTTRIAGISKQLEQLVRHPGYITLPPSSS